MPGFFASPEMVEESLKNKDNPLFIRRLKEDLKDFEGKPIFTRRFPKTIKFHLSEAEKELYNEVSRYVIEQYNKALQLDKKKKYCFCSYDSSKKNGIKHICASKIIRKKKK